tara:strand:- start:9679 stop:10098 length:420 start_codon:yes stop_codon:yes gene_type:complete
MRYVALILLASCTATEVGNALLPDELTFGAGSSDWYGSSDLDFFNGTHEGSSDSTYASLTWHLPDIGEKPLTREERSEIRTAALEAEEALLLSEEPVIKMNIRDGVDPPPVWVLGIAAFILLIVVLAVAFKSKRNKQWH